MFLIASFLREADSCHEETVNNFFQPSGVFTYNWKRLFSLVIWKFRTLSYRNLVLYSTVSMGGKAIGWLGVGGKLFHFNQNNPCLRLPRASRPRSMAENWRKANSTRILASSNHHEWMKYAVAFSVRVRLFSNNDARTVRLSLGSKGHCNGILFTIWLLTSPIWCNLLKRLMPEKLSKLLNNKSSFRVPLRLTCCMREFS